jgi:tetratricopeptide (TPR) repeat protein
MFLIDRRMPVGDRREPPPDDRASSVLERGVRLSESMLWRYQQRFFREMGVRSWSEGHVPQYITTNPFIARGYARVVLGWVRDNRPAIDPEEPFHVIELGSGSGRFAFHVLRSLLAAWHGPVFREIRLRYVMTDFSEATLDSWLGHPRLAPFIDSGVLDFALFDPTTDGSLKLHHSGAWIEPGRAANPVAFLANYFFDGTPHDCFAVEQGILQECYPTVSCEGPQPEEGDPGSIARLKIAFERRPAAPEPYDDADWNEVLRCYAARLDDTTFTFPVSALRCPDQFSRLSDGRMLLLTGDRGWVRETDLLGRAELGFATHGSFSLPVNYHAMAEVVRRRGGRVLLPPRSIDLPVVAFLLGADEHDWAESRLAFNQSVVQFGPDHFFLMKKGIELVYDSLNSEQLLAWLRFSDWDHRVFVGAAPAVMQAAPSLDEPLRQEWIQAVGRVWDGYIPIGEEEDVPSILGQFLLALGESGEAMRYFHRSLEFHGPTASTLLYLAECERRLGRVAEALDYLDRALELEPDAGPIRAFRVRLRARVMPEADGLGAETTGLDDGYASAPRPQSGNNGHISGNDGHIALS